MWWWALPVLAIVVPALVVTGRGEAAGTPLHL